MPGIVLGSRLYEWVFWKQIINWLYNSEVTLLLVGGVLIVSGMLWTAITDFHR